jgi:hypothetical protein
MITNIDILKKDLIRIENLKSFLVDIPRIHPDNPKYLTLWKQYNKWCIEGFWAFDNGGWRFMPPTLFFYGNFFKIEIEQEKIRKFTKPFVRDLDWHIHYSYLECQGFSGFKNDDKYSSDRALNSPTLYKKLEKSGKPVERQRFNDMHSSDGTRKKYVRPRDLIRRLHDGDLGYPLYWNPAQNLILFGSRGGGKSYSIAGITAQVMTFDGIKRFDKETFLNPPTAKVSIGAAITDKSSELITKVVDGLGFLSTEKDLGVWGDPEDDEYLPNPFSRNWEGDVKPGNKKNPYRYTYKVETKAGWKPRGTKTALFHVNYSDKKQDGAQAGAGGRVNLSVYEEVGLMPNFKEALFSNIPTVSNDGEQYGVQVALGTSGNIDLVQQSKQVFNNPQDYNFLAFENIWEDDEHARHIGLFLPAYLADSDFKDENGNTDIEAALEHYYERRLEESQKKDPSAIYNEKMNYPLVPSDMWISNKGSYFPQMELIERERELLKDHTYRTIGRPSKLIWDAESFNGVKVEVNQDDEPFYEFPFDRSMSSIKGCPLIFHEPETIKSSIPSDMYLFTLDPYVSDNIDEGGSVGAFYGFLNPKYWKEGIKQTMVCSYVGKPSEGKDRFYEQCEKLIQYYGNCPRSFWYEANRGDSVKGYFLKKNKLYLLALEPTKEKGSNIYAKKVQNYGVRVNSRTDKIEMIDDTSEWLLSHCYDDKRVVETIPDIFFVRQAIQFNLEPGSNFDAVSSVIIYPLALKELQHIVESEYQKKNKHNPLAGLSMNVNIFKQDRFEEFKRKYEHTIRE